MGAEFLSRHFRDVIRLRNHILDSAQGELCDNEMGFLYKFLERVTHQTGVSRMEWTVMVTRDIRNLLTGFYVINRVSGSTE